MLQPAMLCADHLVYAVPDLDQGIEILAELLGVRAARGGSHPGLGTHNALLSLGPSCYLEIIAPDPAQPAPRLPRWLGVDDARTPRFTTWAATSSNLVTSLERARLGGVTLGSVRTGSRVRADGVFLQWQLTDAQQLVGDGIVPFLIDWGDSPHPASAAPTGATLQEWRAEHPDPPRIMAMLHALEIDMPIDRHPMPRLIAVIDTPKGQVTLC